MNVMSKNVHINFEIGPAKKSGQITKGKSAPSIRLYSELGIVKTHKCGQKCSKCLTVSSCN